QILHESNHPRGGRTRTAETDAGAESGVRPSEGTPPGPHGPVDPLTEAALAATTAESLETAAAAVREGHDPHAGPGRPPVLAPPPAVPYGLAGRPFDRQSPFYFGFLATLGALVAWILFTMAGRLTTTMTILIVAFFLTLALNPIVAWLLERGLRRAVAVFIVFSGLLVTIALIGMLVVPPVVSEGSALFDQAPEYFNQVLQTPLLQQLDAEYEVIARSQEEFTKRVQDGSLAAQILGGVLGAGRVVLNGVFQLLTVLILTLYFLASLPRIKQAAYAAIPASRRPRIVSLSEEIMRRTGAYAAGQGLVASMNALFSYVMMSIVGVPYGAVLAVVVGLLGLIPMVGATLGAIVVGVIAFLTEPRMAIIVGIYYIVYQQIENYVIVPRIMTSTVSVPGAVTIVAALTGGTLLGVLGALLAIPVAAGLLLLYEEVLLPRQRQH
ncbi:MAG: AI-2E family transporter, partial [Dermatophilaceae bacterium]